MRKIKTLEEIIEEQNENRVEEGIFGLEQCKEFCLEELNVFGVDLNTQLKKYVELANNDKFFNKRMVLACYELIEKGE